jgi:hypothetical protein
MKSGEILIVGCLCLLVALLAGCDSVKPEKWETDQKLRTELFFRCMEALPAGPQQTKYNDWDEVVAECDNVAYYQARSCVANCN